MRDALSDHISSQGSCAHRRRNEQARGCSFVQGFPSNTVQLAEPRRSEADFGKGAPPQDRQGQASRACEGASAYAFARACADIREHLLKTLTKPSVIVMDNAPFHPRAKIRAMLEEQGHKLLCLPKYSPDLNPIEQTFSAMKTNWKNAQQNTPLDTIVTSNC